MKNQTNSAPLIEARRVRKRYDEHEALRSVSLVIDEGDIVCLLGPSGSGKSTLLRCIAGLERADSGAIFFRGRDITTWPVYQRGFGMMFQDLALFPHRTVAQNVAFGLKMQGASRTQQEKRVAEMLELVGLAGYGKRSVFELSGGEQQRVALARSLAPSPPLLMLDEPLGSLDRALRERLMDDLRSILKAIGMTSLYVTHDQQEAFAISDRLLLINQGVKVQEGTPEQLYRQPINRFAAEFFGLRNCLPIIERKPLQDHQWQASTALGTFHFYANSPSNTLLIRPEAAQLLPTHDRSPNVITGHVVERSFRGGHYRLVSRHEDQIRLEWEITTPDQDLPQVGDAIRLALRSDAITFLPDS